VSFDAVAPWYRALEGIAFGEALQRCRLACLNEVRSPRRALVVGEGNGRFLCELLRTHPEIEVDCVDASERMIELARKRIEDELPDRVNQVRFLQRDITSWEPPENCYDLLVTHFLLDCFPEVELAAIIKTLAHATKPDAFWLLADFSRPPRGWACLRAQMWLAAMYQFFRVTARIPATELIDPTPFLQAEGFALARQHLFRRGMLKSQLWRK
jgi:ubiquinone/menaquinone biosynthesis C-methylase UbiE